MDVLEPFGRRFRKRFFKDASPWVRDNIGWSLIVFIVPPLAAYFRDRHAPMDWVLIKNSLVLYGFALLVYVLAYLRLTAKNLDHDRGLREQALAGIISERERTIKEREDEISSLRLKPKRSAAEQADFDLINRALTVVGKEKGKAALRFLKNKGTARFGISFGNPTTGPTPPSGLTLNDLLHVYHHCDSEGIVVMDRDPLGGSWETFTMSSHMSKALDAALFEE